MKFSEFVPLDKRDVPAQQLALVRATFGQENTSETLMAMAEFGFMALRAAPAFQSIADQDLANACVAQAYQTVYVMGGRNIYLAKSLRPEKSKKLSTSRATTS